MQEISVNGIAIPEAALKAEVQNHPAPTPEAAMTAASEALVIRELLLQEANRLGLTPDPALDDSGRRETDDEALIRQLLDAEVQTPDADEAVCRRYYGANRGRFRSADLFEAAHILFAASPEDEESYDKAAVRAEQAIAKLTSSPEGFGDMARELSDCTSSRDGGRLGQVALGDTVPEFETFLVNLDEGQLCPVPVKTRYGAHVLRLDKKIEGREVPFEAVRDKIAAYLEDASWRRAAAQYIKILAGRGNVEGLDLDAAESPLVQ